jgi:hypothetical protein
MPDIQYRGLAVKLEIDRGIWRARVLDHSTGAFTTRDAALESARNWIDAKLSGKLDQQRSR